MDKHPETLPENVFSELKIMPARGRWLRGLSAIAGLIAAALGFAAWLDFVPASHAGVAGFIFAVLLALKEAVISLGDILDDGVRNGSFEAPQKSNPSTLRQWFIWLALGCLFLPSCTSTDSSAEIRAAQYSIRAAQLGLIVAQANFQAAMNDPQVPAWQRMAFQAAAAEAGRMLKDEEARLAGLLALKSAAAAGLPVIEVTATK